MHPLIGDVADEAMAERAVREAVELFGALDILVDNAGRTLNKPIMDTTAQDRDALMAVNARGSFVFAREAFRVRTDGRAYLASFAGAQPLGRVAQPEEIAEVLCFLASPRAGFITGAVVAADGGFTAM